MGLDGVSRVRRAVGRKVWTLSSPCHRIVPVHDLSTTPPHTLSPLWFLFVILRGIQRHWF